MPDYWLFDQEVEELVARGKTLVDLRNALLPAIGGLMVLLDPPLPFHENQDGSFNELGIEHLSHVSRVADAALEKHGTILRPDSFYEVYDRVEVILLALCPIARSLKAPNGRAIDDALGVIHDAAVSTLQELDELIEQNQARIERSRERVAAAANG